ncbi:unnamed protein product [Closterium sp. NIES-54]
MAALASGSSLVVPTACTAAGKSSLACSSSSVYGLPALQIRYRRASANASSRSFQRKNLQIMAATDLKEEMVEFANAEKRWRTQIAEGKVKSLSAKEAGYTYQLSDYVLLDVRPSYQHNKAWVKGSLWIPAFDVDNSASPGVLSQKVMTFMMGGWWSGASVNKRNERFMADVVAKIPKSANIIVACQKGLRSLAACEHLYKAGYRNIYWLTGGFDTASDEDFEREGPVPLQLAGIGGMSEFIGWTDPQRRLAKTEGWQYRATFFGRLLVVFLAADLALIGLQQLSSFFHPTRPTALLLVLLAERMSGGPAGGMGGGGTSRDGAQMHPDMAFEWGYSPRAVHSPSRFSRDEEANPNRTKSNLSQQRTLSLSAARLSQAAADLGFHVTASANAPPAAQAGAFPGFSPAAAAAAAAALAAGGDACAGAGLGGGIPGGGLVRGGSGLAGWSGGGVAGAGGAGHLQSLTVDPSKAGISSRGAGGHGVPPLPLPSPKGNAAAAAAANAAAGKLGSPRGNFSGSRAVGMGHWPRAGLPASIQQQLMLGAMGGGAGGGAAGGGAAGLAGLGGMQGGFAGGGGGMGALGNVGGAGMAGMAGMGGMAGMAGIAGLAALNSSSDGNGSGGGSGSGIPGMSLQTQLSLLAAQLDGRLDDNNPLSRTSSAPPLGALLASIGDVAELERLYRLLPDAMSPDVSPHVGLTLPYQSAIAAASGSATSSAVGSVATSPDRELHMHRLLGSMGSGSMGSMGNGSMGSGSMAGYLSSTVPSMAALIRERTKLSRTSSCPPPVAEDMSGGAGGSGMEERGGEGESSESEGESGQHGAGAGHKRKKRRAPGGVGAGADAAGRSSGGGKVLARLKMRSNQYHVPASAPAACTRFEAPQIFILYHVPACARAWLHSCLLRLVACPSTAAWKASSMPLTSSVTHPRSSSFPPAPFRPPSPHVSPPLATSPLMRLLPPPHAPPFFLMSAPRHPIPPREEGARGRAGQEPDDALDGGARLGGRGGGGGGGGGAGSGGRGSAGAWGGSPGGGYSMQGGWMGGSMQAGAMETSSQDYIHVRARRGQATDSHSLAERVRREKISDRMKVLQSLVPTCTKATGKAVMLDEIINYVRSLQLQVELLSAKLAAIEQDTAEMDGSDSPADFCAAQMAALGGLLLPSAPTSAAAAGTGTGGGGNAAAMGGGATVGGGSTGAGASGASGASGGSAGSAGAAAVAAAALAGGSFRQASPSCSQSHDWSTTDVSSTARVNRNAF